MTPADARGTLNRAYSTAAMRRRYEVWFLRFALADGSGAWWFRYLLMNLARGGCAGNPRGMPAQVWATWFPRGEKPLSLIQGYPLQAISLGTGAPFSLAIADNRIGENGCAGRVAVDGHQVAWDLRYASSFAATLSNVGWIGFSRTPHCDALFSGEIVLDGRQFSAAPLGFGVQGHNCGYRHRRFWTWAHAYLASPEGNSSFEALVYDLPLGFSFHKAILFRRGRAYLFRQLRQSVRDRDSLCWAAEWTSSEGVLTMEFDGSGPSLHRLPYLKTDCSSTFEVSNNSLARAQLRFRPAVGGEEVFATADGAVLEMAGG